MSGGGLEVQVHVVGGARSCFAALPLHLIHALERTSATGDLPPVLALELRGPAGARWSLAWSGAASRSSAIEVSGPQPHVSVLLSLGVPVTLCPEVSRIIRQPLVESMLAVGNLELSLSLA